MTISGYPDASSTPAGSTYLANNARREYLSYISFSSLSSFENAQKIIKQDGHKSCAKAVAIHAVDSTISLIKCEVMKYVLAVAQVKPLQSLEFYRNSTISKLADSSTVKEVYSKIIALIGQWLNSTSLENNDVTLQPAFTLSAEDFKIAGYDYQSYHANDRIATCQDYVFYMLNETQAFPCIFNAFKYQWPEEIAHDPITHFKDWGYELVQKPEAGDVVAYYSSKHAGHDHDIKGVHWGLWTSDGKVLSKLGITSVLKHPLEDVVLQYGDFVYFFRKKIKSPLMQLFLNEMQKAEDSIATFSHAATYAPLTAMGCTEVMISLVAKLHFVAFKKSLYNDAYNHSVKEHALKKLHDFSVKEFSASSKAEALEAMKQLVLCAQQEVQVVI